MALDNWKDEFEVWFKSDNVDTCGTDYDTGKKLYITQCTLWRKVFTKKELKKYYKHEYKN